MEVARAHVLVEGRVQGVSYRAWTRRQAKTLGLRGWVRNLDDGRVEAVFEGPREAVEEMVARCEKGSRLASVREVSTSWEEPRAEQGFTVRASGP